MGTIWPTPPARARSTTSGRSAANCPSSRGACVSLRSRGTSAFRGILGREGLESLQVALLRFQQLLEPLPGFNVAHICQVMLQFSDGLPLMLDEERQQMIEGNIVDIGETLRIGPDIGRRA